MTLENTDVSARYKDVVQLEKAGLGLPSHGGAETALHDGAGNQILGRTAVRHWLDPHPDAASFSETWEFSTTGDMTQGQLETAGWAFDAGTSGSVSGGVLRIANSGTGIEGARLTCSFAGDFDVIAAPMYVMENTSAESSFAYPFLGIGDADGTGHYVYYATSSAGTYFATTRVHSATTSNWSGGTSASAATYQGYGVIYRICRTSGTVYITAGYPNASLFGVLATRVPATPEGWFLITTDADAATMDVISLGGVFGSGNASSVYWAFLRRFA